MAKDLLLYVHVPFCTSKCTFCDWVQEVPTSELRQTAASPRRKRYLEALCEQIQEQGGALADEGYAPSILYFGGGTASILEIAELASIVEAISDAFDRPVFAEATLECSPETVDAEKLRQARAFGFGRVSIGVQSLDDRILRILGRAHSGAEAVRSVALAAEAGFEAINIDLLSGVPTQSLQDFEASMSEALSLPATHVSFYPFRPTPGTMFSVGLRQGRFGRLDVSEQLAIYDRGRELLDHHGFPQYGVTHFGATRCKSDLAYFRLMMDWAGFGSGATSLLKSTFLMSARGRLHQYTDRPCEPDVSFPAASRNVASRLFYQSLHTPEGAEARRWEERTGVGFAEILAQTEVQWLIRRLGNHANVIRDDAGVRLDPVRAGHAFIHLLNDYAPVAARDSTATNSNFHASY